MKRLALALAVAAVLGMVAVDVVPAVLMAQDDAPDVVEHCHNVSAGTTGPPIFCEVPTSTSTTTSSTTLPATTAPATTTTTSTTSTTSPAATTSTVAPTVPEPPPSTSTTSPPTTAPNGAAFVEDFSTPESMSRFVQHTGNYCSPGTSCRPEDGHVRFFPGDHDMSCGGPTTSRTVDVAVHSNLFWWCAPNGPDTGHVMIGNDISGYGIVSLSPNQTFHDVTRICWDISHTDLGGGKWFNVLIVPESLYLSNPNTNPRRIQDGEGPYRMDYTSPGFNDDNAPGDFNLQGDPTFGFKQFRSERSLWRDNGTDSFVWHEGGHHVSTEKPPRYRHCLEDVGGAVRITQQTPGGTTVDTVSGGGLPDGAVRVIFQDDTYDSIKHDGIPANKTWHLDNVEIR